MSAARARVWAVRVCSILQVVDSISLKLFQLMQCLVRPVTLQKNRSFFQFLLPTEPGPNRHPSKRLHKFV